MKKNKITFLGIDGSGKSTLTKLLAVYLKEKGYSVTLVPFHKWIFADFFRDKLKFGKIIDRNRKPRKTSYYAPKKESLSAIIKPPIALIDNIIFYILNRSKKDKEIFIYDRFICATQIKLSALNYHSRWLKYIWRNISTDQTFVIDIDPELSLQRQLERNDPYTYPIEILQREREGYMDLGKAKGYTIIDNSDSLQAALNTVIETLKSKNMI